MPIMILPPEIWENILGNLTAWDAVNCARVCCMWHEIMGRKIRDVCQRTWSTVYLLELLTMAAEEKGHRGNERQILSTAEAKLRDTSLWVRVFELDLLTKHLSYLGRRVLHGREFLKSFENLVVKDDSDEEGIILKFYSLPQIEEFCLSVPKGMNLIQNDTSLSNDASPCTAHVRIPGKLHELYSLGVQDGTMIMVATVMDREDLFFFTIQSDTEGVLKASKLQVHGLPTKLFRPVSPHRSFISADNSGTLAVAKGDSSISLFRPNICYDDFQQLQTDYCLVGEITFISAVSQFSLHQNTLKTILKNGVVTVHELRESKCRLLEVSAAHLISTNGTPLTSDGPAQPHGVQEAVLNAICVGNSCEYRDLAYPNPTFFCQHHLFVSSAVTSRLLYYWHMDRNIDYWLTAVLPPKTAIDSLHRGSSSSLPDDQTHSSVVLHKASLGGGVEVLAVHYQRGLLFAATVEGHVLVYRYQCHAPHQQDGGTAVLPALDVPLLDLRLADLPLTRVATLFSERFIYVFALVKNSSVRVAIVELNANPALREES
ncbi:uncharacterized protein LOC108676496 [Hyalella azteca]|uniref:Uncharacterized protein LOC108676496 n=1 Tax=Hyalella azteca TaxID=294128 RepID=A0A8B7P1U9_HYAAZ|nr:uncharacterized protein LOC108676496 [Hyalella azteca]